MKSNTLRVGIAQYAPKWLDKKGTLEVIGKALTEAGDQGVELLVFGEAFWPGYPFWLAYMDGAAWELPANKALHAHYLHNAVDPENGDLDPIIAQASALGISVYLGIVERPRDRGGHSLYCSLAYIDASRGLCSLHRKLQPTYDERLTWAPGDGHGLQVHSLKGFQVGGLNCWENWMPLVRASLYAQGENVHIAVWPGSDFNTRDITRFIARESRGYVISASALMRREDFPADTPFLSDFIEKTPAVLANGGSCIAGPDGEWVLEPQIGIEGVMVVDLVLGRVYEERQNFDPSGHYSRPDVTRLVLDRSRQTILGFGEADI